MKTSQTTAGATLVLTVLVVMVLLSVVVVVTGQLTLAARRSSADQQATTQVQYIAESGVARAQARLKLVNNLMADSLQPDANNTSTTKMLTWMYNLCGVAAPTTAQLTSPVSTITLATPQTLCVTPTGSTDLLSSVTDLGNSVNLNFFTANIPDSAYAADGYDLGSDLAAGEKTFWAQSLKPGGVSLTGKIGGSTTDNLQGSSGLALQKVQRFGQDSYRLTFTVPDVTATSTATTASRKLTVAGASDEYAYEISRGSFAKYALFTNHHFANAQAETDCKNTPSACNRVTFTSNTLFSGPVHTNQNYLAQGTPYFAGQVTSAGCPPGHIVAATDSNGQPTERCDAAATPGAYFAPTGTTLTSPTAMDPNPNAPVTCNVATRPCPTANTVTNPQFQGGVKWDEPFQPLPKNANNQATAAANGGISLNGTVDAINLSVGTITPGGGSTTAAQFISYTQNGTTVNLATTPDKKMYVKVGAAWQPAVQLSTGAWVSAVLPVPNGQTITATTFNGVVFTAGSVTSIKGPARTVATDPATAAPAVASFSQLTLAATGDMHIKGDLKYETPPCAGSNSVAGTPPVFTAAPCANTAAANILGLYSSGGDIDIDSPAKYPGNGVGKDVTIQAVLMASSGRVTVDGYDQGAADSSLGQVRLLGGIIENYYGPFGITDGRGFGRNYVYDPRTGDGLAPPSFPTQQSWNTDFKKTTDASGASTKTPLLLNGSQIQQKLP